MRPLVALAISQAMNLRTELEAARASTAKVFGRARPPAAQLAHAAPCRCLVDTAGVSVSLTLALAYLVDLEATLEALGADVPPESHGARRTGGAFLALVRGDAGMRAELSAELRRQDDERRCEACGASIAGADVAAYLCAACARVEEGM